MIKYVTINHFYSRFNQHDCFNSNWRQKCPPLRKYFLCRPEIGIKQFNKLKPEPGMTEKPAHLYNSRSTGSVQTNACLHDVVASFFARWDNRKFQRGLISINVR